MLKTRRTIAQNVFDHLLAAERSTDQALIDTAELVSAMLKARLDLQAAAVFGQDAFDAVASTFASHAESRRKIVAAHNALATVRDNIGLSAVSFGGAANKDVNAFNANPPLSLVDAVAA